MAGAPLDSLPGFRRRFIVTPGEGFVRSAVEDDFHCMIVTIRHDGSVATAIEPQMERAPWTTCPGAIEQLKATFTGVPLASFGERGEKPQNCTHLHDLAVIAAAHAGDTQPLVYDILVSDAVDGIIRTELRRDGVPLMNWALKGWEFLEPAELAGQRLDTLRGWIDSLDVAGQEAARVLRWATFIAHGRSIPLANQSDATRMPPNCFTFQPDRAAVAVRVGEIRDFSDGKTQPLEQLARSGGGDGLPFDADAA